MYGNRRLVLLELLERSSSSSLTHHGYKYNMFLSFRGENICHSFTDYLHKVNMYGNITTFLDDVHIETREDLKPELENMIKESRASVIVLSKNYVTSTWCLGELVLIIEQHRTSSHIVTPIFYHVEPTRITSSFGDAMAKHKQLMETETNANKKKSMSSKDGQMKKNTYRSCQFKKERCKWQARDRVY